MISTIYLQSLSSSEVTLWSQYWLPREIIKI